ncbi:MAG: SDR family oxidoreductase [Dehalococcoidales bacterium]|nr:MAG: SDR family oxidoreductase [Dehalococcoidales bacterium]
MDLQLEGKIALITGTASQIGMGNAISKYLAGEGCDIVSVDIELDGAQKTADAVKASGKKAVAYKVDVANKDEVNEAVKSALKEFGRIDILVNTAGLSAGKPTPFTEQDQETWQKDIDVNLYGTMFCSQAVLPGMVEQKYGKIVNFSSIAARQPLLGSYAAAKAAVISITHGLAAQYGPEGINANAIAPGVLKTNFFGEPDERIQQMMEGMASRVPTRRIQTVEDIVHIVAFLVSDVSKNITGQCIQVDSGLVMR